jgi:hypothetical protein
MQQNNFESIDKVLGIVVAIVLVLILMHTCGTNGQLNIDHKKMKDQIENYKVQHLSDSSKLISQAINYQNEIDSKDIALKKLNIRNPKEVVKIKYKTIVQTEIKLSDPIVIDSSNYIKLPVVFSDYNDWWSIDGSIDSSGVLKIDSIVSTGTLTYSVGDTLRNGLFNRLLRKYDSVIRLHIDNPTMSISNLSNIYMNKTPKWFQTTAFKVGVGVLIGIGLTSQIAK